MRYLFSVFAMLSLLIPSLVHAESASTDVYGDEVIAKSFDVLNPSNAALAPDGAYADFRDDSTYLTIDMGEGEEGHGALILTIRVIQYGATARVTFYDKDMVVLHTVGGLFNVGATTWTATYDGEESYRYVKIESPEEEEWGLDAVQATQVDTPSSTDDEDEESDNEEEIPYGIDDDLAGKLVRTSESSSVYLIGEDGQRHAFPNEAVFTSWGYDFSDVQYISVTEMSTYALGKNVTVRPGTWLVKVTMNPKVYAVGTGGVLHWVANEDTAEELYGSDWNTRVIDVSEVFWNNYDVGIDLQGGDGYALGSVVADGGVTYIVEVGGVREISDEEKRLLRIDDDFVLDGDVSQDEIISGDAENDDLVDEYHAY